MMIQEGILWAMIAAETVATGVTTAFGAAVAFLTSPITLVILGIGALIAIIYLLVTNWDAVKEAGANAWQWIKDKWNEAGAWFNSTIVEPIKNFFNGLWQTVQTKAGEAWEGVKSKWSAAASWFRNTFIAPVESAFKGMGQNIKSFLTNPLESIKSSFRSAFNWIIGKMNGLIGGLNKLQVPDWVPLIGGKGINIPRIPSIKSSFRSAFNWIIGKMNGLIGGLNKLQVPDWVPLIGGKGINIPRIPMLYKGTDYFQPTRAWGNMAIVGEEGPELVELPTGAKVNTASDTQNMIGKGMTVNIYTENSSPSEISRKLKNTLRQMAYGI